MFTHPVSQQASHPPIHSCQQIREGIEALTIAQMFHLEVGIASKSSWNTATQQYFLHITKMYLLKPPLPYT